MESLPKKAVFCDLNGKEDMTNKNFKNFKALWVSLKLRIEI